MKKLKRIGLALVVAQIAFNVATVAIFLFTESTLRSNGNFSAFALLLIWVGGVLSVPAVGIFSYATQREQTYQKASQEGPEGGRIAQRDLTIAIVAFVSEMVTLYWVLR